MSFLPAPWFLVLFLLLPSLIPAQIRVTITPPPFVNVGAVLEDLVSQKEINSLVSGPLEAYEAQAVEQIGGGLAKPGLYAGLADAATLPLLVLARPSWESSRFSLLLGTSLAVESDSFDPKVLADRLQTLRPEVDYRVGAAAHPVMAAFSWTPVSGALAVSLGAFGSASSLVYSPVQLVTRAGGASLHLKHTVTGAAWGPLAWQGYTLSVSGGWASNRYDTALILTLPTRVVPLNLTYIDAGEVVITGEPRFALSLVNQGVFWPVQLSSEISVGRMLRLGVAAGAMVGWGQSSLEIRGKNPIHLQSATQSGLYEKFLSDTAWVDVEGTLGGATGPSVQGFGTLTPSWAVGSFRWGVPITWRYPGGLSVALLWGLAL